MKWLQHKKSYILGGIMIVHGLVSFLTGDMSFQEFIEGSKQFYEVMGGATAISIKAAVAKGPKL